MKRKSWVSVLALLMAITLLAACGNNANNAGTNSGDTGGTGGSKDVTIKFYNWDPDQNAIKSIIADFEAENPGIKVSSEVLVPGGSADDNLTKLDVLMATGEDVDVVAIPNQEYTVLRAANSMFLPLTDYFAQDGVDVDEDYLTSVKYNDDVYAVPQFVNQWYVMLNKDHLDEAGLSVPQVGWTWDEYREYAKKMTKGEGPSKQYGTYFHTWGEFANPMLYTEKANPYMLNETTSIFDDASFDYWFDLRRAMEKEDKSVKTYSDVIGSKLNYRTEFFNEQASMIFIGSWTIADIGNVESYPHDFTTAFAPMPRMNEQSPIGGTNVAGEFLALSKSTDHPEEAYKFLRYLSTKGSEKRGAISGWRGANSEAFISAMLEKNPNLYDEESLKHTLFNEHVHSPNTGEINIAYGSEMKSGVLEAGFAKFILDNTSAADAKAYMVSEANKIIKQNQ